MDGEFGDTHDNKECKENGEWRTRVAYKHVKKHVRKTLILAI